MEWFYSRSQSNKLSSLPKLPQHPYYPPELHIENYATNNGDFATLTGGFAAGCVVLLGSTWVLASQLAPRLKTLDKTILMWFVMSMNSGIALNDKS